VDELVLHEQRIKLVVFDLAGTIVDHGCFAPVTPFIEALRRNGVDVTVDQVRGPMGLGKEEHLRALLRMPEAAAQWRSAHGSDAGDDDVHRIFVDDFVPLQLASVTSASNLISGLLPCVAELRARGIKIATSTGYFAEAAELCWAAAREQGFEADCHVHPGQVRESRPAPWMVFRAMEALDVYPPSSVVKVGDTVPDIEEARNAGAWAVGVAATGSLVGLGEDELAALPPDERARRIDAAGQVLIRAGADYVVDSIRDLPNLVAEIEQRRHGTHSVGVTP
jgi:phosphonoacetaldehyde hydrolase